MTEPISVIFAGTPDFAVPSLRALLEDDRFTVPLVLTQPDKPVGRKRELTPPPVKTLAQEYGTEVAQPENVNNFQFSIFNFQFLVVVAYGQLLKPHVLDMPETAAVNVHASLLPRWRGAAPIQAAILAGDNETGVTVQQMVPAMDAGDILAQDSVPLTANTTAPQLHDTLAEMGADLLIRTLAEPLHPVPQNEEDVTYCKKLTRQDGAVNPDTMKAAAIDRHVRALVPWPGVTCPVHGHTVKLLRTVLHATENSLPLPCAEDTVLYVEELQSPGSKPLSGTAWLRGHKTE